MADNVQITAGSGTTIATDDAGAGGHVQIVKLAQSADGSASPILADGNGLEVQLGASLPAGTNNIGDVDVLTLPSIPAGTNNIGDVDIASIAAGDNNIGNVDVVTTVLPVNRTATGDITAATEFVAIACAGGGTVGIRISGTWTGTINFEGSVDGGTTYSSHYKIDPANGSVNSQTTTVTGTFLAACAGLSHFRVRASAWTSGTANITLEVSAGSSAMYFAMPIPSGDNNIGNVDIVSLPALASGTNNIGDVDVLTLPPIPAGTNNIGDVDVLTLPAPLGAAGATSVAKAEDAASATADVGIPAMAVRKATPADTSDTDGDYEMLQMKSGRLWTSTTVDAALPTGDNNIGNVDVLTLPSLPAGTNNIGDVDVLSLPALPAGTNNIGDVDVLTLPGVAGSVAHATADSGNPVKIGAKADSSLTGNTMVAAGDRTDVFADIDGVLMVKHMCPNTDIISERVTDTGGTSTAFTNFGAVASTRNYVTTIIVYNSSATAGFLDLRDGTAGSVIMTVPLPAGGGAVVNLPVPLRQPTANTALAYDVSAAITTVYISLVGFQSKA